MMDFFRLIISSLEPSQNLKSGFEKNITGFEKSAVNLDQGCPESGRSNATEPQSTSMEEGDAVRDILTNLPRFLITFPRIKVSVSQFFTSFGISSVAEILRIARLSS